MENAAECHRVAADQNDSDGSFPMDSGSIQNGIAVARDAAKGAEYYRFAANQSGAFAKYNLESHVVNVESAQRRSKGEKVLPHRESGQAARAPS
jgi:hypothetical protein